MTDQEHHIPPFEPPGPMRSSAPYDPPPKSQAGLNAMGIKPALPDSRADFVLFLGVISLFLCAPLGIAAWLMAGSDLKKIQKGLVSSRKRGTLKAGRALGIVGTFLSIGLLVAAGFLVNRGLEMIRGGVSGWEAFGAPEPLRPDQIAFVGEWQGDRGTVIRIQADGRGDFQADHSSLTGGKVMIEKEVLSIGIFGVSKKWTIEAIPHVQDGIWLMKLDGEEFRKTDGGLMVRLDSGRG